MSVPYRVAMLRRWTTLVVVAVLAAALLGCGDDEESDEVTAVTDDTGTGDTGDETGDGGGELPDACGLLEAAELEPVVGSVEPEAERDTSIDGLDYRQCTWESADTLLIVAVVDGSERFETHVANLGGEPVDGVGDEALVATGMSSETRGGTGGRTISARVGDRTVVVALRLPGETPTDAVLPLAQAVAGRVG